MLWLIVIALALVAASYVWFDFSQSSRGEVKRLLICPESGRDVEVTFRSDYLDPYHYQDVAGCSAFLPEERVACDEGCLRLGKHLIDRSVAV